VRPITLAEVEAARERIAGIAVRTPLLRLEMPGRDGGAPDVWLKLENLQPINAYKVRGAANAIACLPHDRRAHGVWTISAGNAGQGVAYAARAAGIRCTVVAIETAPRSKLQRMEALGARIVTASYDACWQALDERRFPGVEGTFIHPFDDDDFIAGHATVALEILEDLPDCRAVYAAIGGGGLITAIGSVTKALRPEIRVIGVEPETAAPAALSAARGSPQVFKAWQASFVDGAGGKSMFPRMWQRLRPVVDDFLTVTLEQTKDAMRILARHARVVAEGAGALPVAAALSDRAGKGPVVAVVSGGNIDIDVYCGIIASAGG
jgi:threonine dehydratase